jgi:hypothetical protein
MTERERALRAALTRHRKAGTITEWRHRDHTTHRWKITDHAGSSWVATREAELYVRGLDAAAAAAAARLAAVPSWPEEGPAVGPHPMDGDGAGGRLEYRQPTLTHLGGANGPIGDREGVRLCFAYTERRKLVTYEASIGQSDLFRVLVTAGLLTRVPHA